MKIDPKDFRVPEEETIKLGKWPAKVSPCFETKEDYEDILREHIRELSELQSLMYAHNRYALLLVFQGMDAAGKDGAIQHVMSGINPTGCQVYSFKTPSAEELDHDFLWRTTCDLPERGRIGIFNRSYYEEVIVVRVHPSFLENQNLPTEFQDHKNIWAERYQSINNLEKHLYRNGTRVIKFFLHLSKDEQRKRLLERIDDPEKNWKFSRADVEERQYWDDYMSAYEECLGATSTKESPWYIVPADEKKNCRLIISKIILDAMKDLQMHYPPIDDKRREELQLIRKMLALE